MPDLPSGTVTFLFTDVERSTQTVGEVGDERYAELQDVHRKLLREAFAAHNGVEVGTEGDAFFVAFGRANDAVAAAIEGQRALASGSELRVRMGLHTGEALLRDGGYVGHEVHRAKRISDAGHGGQILLSQTTADLIGTNERLKDLGPHRLKDLSEAQRIYQLIAENLPETFPPLRSLEAFSHSLPAQRSSFVGRESEIAEVRELLRTNRVVTLTGVGGCGKTRLALQVAAEELDTYTDGVFFVNLAPISDPGAIAREVATVVGVSAGARIATVAGATEIGEEALLAHLASRSVLLVLDNCEHMVDGCAEISDKILARCPGVVILATSREGLRVEGEQAWVIPSLSLPSDDDAQLSESVSLFQARAKAVRPDFELTRANTEAVGEVCRRLDGIPLAIEFAAARVGHLSPRQIADRLDDRFRLLVGGQRRVQRQQTLHAALDWSYDLLDEIERILLRRLAVFHGHFSLDAAEGICADEDLEASSVTDVLGSLVAKSLVETAFVSDALRYRLLETVRAYAAERLAQADEAMEFRNRHKDWFVDSFRSHSWERRAFHLSHYENIVRESANLIGAAELSIAQSDHAAVGKLLTGTSSFWGSPGKYGDAHRWSMFALEGEERLDPDDRVACLTRLGASPFGALEGERLAWLDRAVAAAEEASPSLGAWCRVNRAWMASIVAAATRDEELTARCYRDLDEAAQLSRGETLGMVLWFRAQVDMHFGRVAESRAPLEKALLLFDESGEHAFMAGVAMHLGVVAHLLGDDSVAQRALGLWRQTMDRWSTVRDPDSTELALPGSGVDAPYAVLVAAAEGTEAARAHLMGCVPVTLAAPLALDRTSLVLGYAVVSALEGDVARCMTLLGWFRANTFGVGLPPRSSLDYILYLHYRDFVRSSLAPDELKRARDEGGSMTIEHVLEFAVEGARA